jgi:hypothetical protein
MHFQVVLIEPTMKQANDSSKPVRLNKHNHVEWDVDLQPQETKEIVLKYSVELPASESLEISYANESSI